MDPYLLAQHYEMEERHWWFAARKVVIADVLQRWVPPSTSPRQVLDIGCGAGAMIDVLRTYGAVTALDSSETAIAHVRARHPEVSTLVGELPSALPKNAAFDVVTALDVIEHIPDDGEALRALRRSMTPGGLLVSTVPAHQWLWGPHDDLNRHQRRYSRAGFVRALRGAGFTVDWDSYFNTFLFPPIAAVRLARRAARREGAPASDFDVEAGPLNGVLRRLFAAERHVLRHTRLPFGVSLLAIAHNPGPSPLL